MEPAQVSGAAASRARWTSARMLRLMLGAQCLLAVFVVASDLPLDLLSGPRAPETEVPVAPGDQTRQFHPRRLPTDRPAGPGFPRSDSVSPRLDFTETAIGGRDGTLLLTGTIAPGDARRFAEHLEAMPEPPAAIALHSPGGAVDQALEIGREIRAASLPVIVASGAACFSACPYILAAGVEREVSRQALIGVHQHYFGQNTYLPAFMAVSDVQAGQAEVMTYLSEMGIDPMVMAKALATPPDDIYILLPEELETLRMATSLTE